MWPLFESAPPAPHAGLTNMVIPTGNAGTSATIAEMQKLVSQGKRDQRLRQLLSQILNESSCPEKDYLAYATAIFNYCRDKIRYVRDPYGVELVETPMRVVQNGVADCDSICILFCSLCEQCGLPCRFVTIKTNPMHDLFTHVYSQVNVNGRWYSADCTMKQFDFGWTPPAEYPSQSWPASSEGSEMGISGLPVGEICQDEALGCQECGGTCGMHELMISDVSEEDGMGALACCGIGEMGCCGMGEYGMGAMPSAGQVSLMIEKMNSGEFADELKSARNRMGANLGYTFDALNKAQYEGSSETLEAAQKARAAVLKENESLQRAIDAYNRFAQDIQTRSAGYYTPTQLGAIPLVPIAVIAGALVGVAFAFNTAMSAWRGDANSARGYLDQLSSALDSAGIAVERTGSTVAKTTTTFAVVGAVGLGLYLLMQHLQKKGRKA